MNLNNKKKEFQNNFGGALNYYFRSNVTNPFNYLQYIKKFEIFKNILNCSNYSNARNFSFDKKLTLRAFGLLINR